MIPVSNYYCSFGLCLDEEQCVYKLAVLFLVAKYWNIHERKVQKVYEFAKRKF